MRNHRRVAKLQPGDEITSLEGVDLLGERAVVVDLVPSGSSTTVTLLFPDLKASKKYKVPSDTLSKVERGKPRKAPSKDVVDGLRATSPERTVPPIRDGVPDTFFPPDVNGTQPTMTDVLWRPTVRRTPFTRGLQASSRGRYGAEAKPEEGDQFYLLIDLMPFASFKSNKSKDERSEIAQKTEFKGKLERGLEKAFNGKQDLSYRLKYVGTKNQKEYHIFVTFNNQKAYNLGLKVFSTVQDHWAPEDAGLNMVLYKVGPIKDGKMSVTNSRSKPVYAGVRRSAKTTGYEFSTYPALDFPPQRDLDHQRVSTGIDDGYEDGSPQRPRKYNRPYETRWLRSQRPLVDPSPDFGPYTPAKEKKLAELAELFWQSYKETQLTKLPSRPGLGHTGLHLDDWATIWLQETGISVKEMDELFQYMIATRQATATAYRAWKDKLRQNMLHPMRTPNYDVDPAVSPQPDDTLEERTAKARRGGTPRRGKVMKRSRTAGAFDGDEWGITNLGYVLDAIYRAAQEVVDSLENVSSSKDEIFDESLVAAQDIYSDLLTLIMHRDPEYLWDMPAELLDISSAETLRDAVGMGFANYLTELIVSEVMGYYGDVRTRQREQSEEEDAVIRHHEQVLGSAPRRRGR